MELYVHMYSYIWVYGCTVKYLFIVGIVFLDKVLCVAYLLHSSCNLGPVTLFMCDMLLSLSNRGNSG